MNQNKDIKIYLLGDDTVAGDNFDVALHKFIKEKNGQITIRLGESLRYGIILKTLTGTQIIRIYNYVNVTNLDVAYRTDSFYIVFSKGKPFWEFLGCKAGQPVSNVFMKNENNTYEDCTKVSFNTGTSYADEMALLQFILIKGSSSMPTQGEEVPVLALSASTPSPLAPPPTTTTPPPPTTTTQDPNVQSQLKLFKFLVTNKTLISNVCHLVSETQPTLDVSSEAYSSKVFGIIKILNE